MQSRGKRERSNSSFTARSVRRKKERKTYIDSLPDELLFDILVRLPAVFLHGRARHVSRSWSHIIQSRDFINAHSQRHSTYGLVLSSQSMCPHRHSICVTAAQGGRIETSELSQSYISMATSCNGLTLQVRRHNAQDRAFSLHVINPATNHSFRLPKVGFRKRTVYEEQCGIAYSAASMEYKVALPYYDERRQSNFLDIVTVGVDKSWRRVVNPRLLHTPDFYPCLVPQSSEGFLHWGSWRYCLTLNVETEIITVTKVPIHHPSSYYYQRYSCSLYYLSTGRYLTVLIGLNNISWDVWEMKPAESGEWRKTLLSIIRLEPPKLRPLNPIGWVKYPEVLAFSSYQSKRISFYNLETQEITTTVLPQQYSFYSPAFVHMISLARLSQD